MADEALADVVRLRDVRKVYRRTRDEVVALDGVTLGFGARTFTAVMGPSGSGKSTFLHCAAGLDRPTSGSVQVEGRELADLRENDLAVLRRSRIGFVFQQFNLLPALTVRENVALPLRLARRAPPRRDVDAIVDQVGLAGTGSRRPHELSGGQQQRVAIARALVTGPAVTFADEPTGALDTTTSEQILALMARSVREAGQTIVMVTHDPVAAAWADRVVFLADGRVVDEMSDPTADAVANRMTGLRGSRSGVPDAERRA